MNRALRDENLLPQPGTTYMPGDPSQEQPAALANGQLMMFPDQSAVMLPNMQPNQDQTQSHFNENLVPYLPPEVLRRIGGEIKEAVDEDFQSRQPFIEAITETLPYLGLNLTDMAILEGEFEHASQVFSSALLESLTSLVIEVFARLYKENDMVDPTIVGESNIELENVATRLKYFFNNYLTYELKEFRPESKRTIMWAVLAGTAYKKVYWDPAKQQPTSLLIPVENFAINADHASQYASGRKTHLEYLSRIELQVRQEMGYYARKGNESAYVSQGDEEGNELISELNQISGIDDDDRTARDNKICIAEHHTFRYIEQDQLSLPNNRPSPYRITINRATGEIYAIYRNWHEDDQAHKERQWFVPYTFYPSLKGEGYGLIHIAGNLAKAATMVGRQLINAGIYANFPAFMYQKGLRIEENNLRIPPGTGMGVATGGTPLSDAVMPLPYKDPSPALFQIQQSIEESIRRPCAILNSKLEDMSSNAPVGTTLAMLEALQKVPNSIMQGFYESFAEELQLLRDCFYEHMSDQDIYPFMVPGGQHVVMKQDFNPKISVKPVAEPALHSSSYRLIRAEILLNNARQSPELHNMRYAYDYYYQALNVPTQDIQQLLPPPPEPPQPPPAQDPISENGNLMQAQPVKAYMFQDDEAHIAVHSMLLNDQSQQMIWAQVQAHIQEHKAQKMTKDMYAQLNMPVPQPQELQQLPPEQQNEIATAMAQVALQQQQEQQQSQPQPLDPAQVALAEVEMQGKISERKTETEMLRIQTDKEKFERESLLKEQEIKQRGELDGLKLQLDTKKFELDTVLRERDMLIKELSAMKKDHKPNESRSQHSS